MSVLGAHGLKTGVTHTEPQHNLLDRAANKKGEWVYVQANGTVAQYGFVRIDDDGQADALTTTLAGSGPVAVGVAQVAFADNDYGWVWVGRGGGVGKGVYGKVAASYVADAKLQTTAVAGVADDAATTVIANVRGLTTDGGSGSSVELFASGTLSCN